MYSFISDEFKKIKADGFSLKKDDKSFDRYFHYDGKITDITNLDKFKDLTQKIKDVYNKASKKFYGDVSSKSLTIMIMPLMELKIT